uniref:Uncharacterized protein n=1 Tax=Arion vulgaris TaxID=1028688 RepID=A0A0B7BKK1_9EUPU
MSSKSMSLAENRFHHSLPEKLCSLVNSPVSSSVNVQGFFDVPLPPSSYYVKTKLTVMIEM